MDSLATVTNLLAELHEYDESVDEDSTAPLTTLIEQLEEAVSQPSPDAPPHAGLRADVAGLLYSSHSPPDLTKWIDETHVRSTDKTITIGRKRVFDLLTSHLDKYEAAVFPHAHALLTCCLNAYSKEQGSDQTRQAALRTFRKALRRLPKDHGLT